MTEYRFGVPPQEALARLRDAAGRRPSLNILVVGDHIEFSSGATLENERQPTVHAQIVATPQGSRLRIRRGLIGPWAVTGAFIVIALLVLRLTRTASALATNEGSPDENTYLIMMSVLIAVAGATRLLVRFASTNALWADVTYVARKAASVARPVT